MAVDRLPTARGGRAKGSGFYVGLIEYAVYLALLLGKSEAEILMNRDTAFSLITFCVRSASLQGRGLVRRSVLS